MSTYMNEEEVIIFQTYKEFKKALLERFTDPNSTDMMIEKLLNLWRGKMEIQEYVIKVLNLAFKSELEVQATKTLMFRGLYPRDQDQMMMINSIKTEMELKTETMKVYLERIIRLFQREEVRWQKEKKDIPADKETNVSAIWNQEEDSMELDQTEKRKIKRTYFKCGKKEHIRRFCKEKTFVIVESEKETSPGSEKNLKKKEL